METDLVTISMAALAAGDAIMTIYETEFSVEEKADGSPLTQADCAAHAVVKNALAGRGIPMLSEEGRDIAYSQRKHWQAFWLVDPLDGTKEFIHRRGEFTVNIARIENGRPRMGAVYLPAAETLYIAADGIGAFRIDGKQLPVLRPAGTGGKPAPAWSAVAADASRLPLTDAGDRPYTIIGSRSHGSEAVAAFVEKRRQEHGEVAFISAGSSLKFCRVAEGAADVYPRFGPTMEWDTAAGQAVAEAAGAEVVEAETGRPLVYNKEDLRNPHFVVRRR